MILHLHTDSRFTNYTLALFHSSRNAHLVGKRFPGQKLKYIDNSYRDRLDEYVFGWSDVKKVISKHKPNVVVIHFLDPRWSKVIHLLSEDVKVVWIFWGGDGYRLPKIERGPA